MHSLNHQSCVPNWPQMVNPIVVYHLGPIPSFWAILYKIKYLLDAHRIFGRIINYCLNQAKNGQQQSKSLTWLIGIILDHIGTLTSVPGLATFGNFDPIWVLGMILASQLYQSPKQGTSFLHEKETFQVGGRFFLTMLCTPPTIRVPL